MEDEDDFVVYGTPLEREEDVASNKKKRQALDQGRLRAGSFSQEVYDENGRRRFHGAFTGGFSAGYYNTVGSKEGWVPQSFTSSRKNRSELALQRPYDYMDDEERAEQDSTRLVTTSEYDTFALTAADLARKEASQELKKRPSAIPGLPPDDIIVPVSRSIGYELLRKMGWRHGRSIGPKHIAASSAAQREGRIAMLAFAQSGQDRAVVTDEAQDVAQLESDADVLTISTPIYVRNPKKDRYGFGFDPYKNAPEFRERRRNEAVSIATKAEKGHHSVPFKSSLFRPNVGKMGGGFGIGALEELGEEDEDVYAPDLEFENILSDHDMDTASLRSDAPHSKQIEWKSGVLPGFRPASRSGSKIELFPPPVVPPDFNGKHQFRDSLESETIMFSYEPPEVAPPNEIQLKKLIDGLATFVARSGQKLENLYMDKRSGDSMYTFLNSGNGHEYYKRRLWEEHKKNLKEETKETGKESTLDSVERGQLLGEIPLQRSNMVPPEDRARLQSALSSAFTTSKDGDSVVSSQHFSADPSKQARFELYLKDKYQGGLRDIHATGKSTLNELERAQERLEFEAACQSLQKSNSLAPSAPMGIYQKDLQAIMSERFTGQSTEKMVGGLSQSDTPLSYPVREEKPWRPRPLLCKRFDLPDPYSGKPPPLPKPRSRTESFILLSSPVASIANPSKVAENQPPADSSASMDSSTHHMNQTSSLSPIQHLETENQATMIVEKPVDLYKAIFSDDSDDEIADSQDQGAHPISAEAAHAALNRLEAGDFLASIGKELGLQVPPAEANQLKRAPTTSHQAHATEVIKKYHSPLSSDCQMGKPAEQNLNVSGKVMEAGKEWHENTESKGVFLDYPRLELSAEHFDVFSKLSSKPSLPKNVSEDCHNVKAVSEDELLPTNMSQESPDDSSSDESSDSHRKRQNRKRKKKGHRHSRSDRKQSGKDYKRRKKREESKHQLQKHRRHRQKEPSS